MSNPGTLPPPELPRPAKPFPLGSNVGLQATMGQTGYGKTRMMSHELLGKWEKMSCTKITHYSIDYCLQVYDVTSIC